MLVFSVQFSGRGRLRGKVEEMKKPRSVRRPGRAARSSHVWRDLCLRRMLAAVCAPHVPSMGRVWEWLSCMAMRVISMARQASASANAGQR